MLDVFFTVDVEVWCDGWKNIDEKFPKSFSKYIMGPTSRGNFGMPYQLDVLKHHGLTGVFFIEPLFAMHFGMQPLADIVGLVNERSQEVQLHMHTEWVDVSKESLLEGIQTKRQHMRNFSREDQTILIKKGASLLKQVGGGEVNAFRAGNFGFNRNTLNALAANGIPFDSSYNATIFGPDSGVAPGEMIVEPIQCEGVYEYPMTVYNDGTRSLRHTQLTACTYNEIETLLWQALEAGRKSFVILSHSFELLNRAKDRPDDIVVERFKKLCAFMEKNQDSFHMRGFHGLEPQITHTQPPPLVSPVWRTGYRLLEQGYRKRFG